MIFYSWKNRHNFPQKKIPEQGRAARGGQRGSPRGIHKRGPLLPGAVLPLAARGRACGAGSLAGPYPPLEPVPAKGHGWFPCDSRLGRRFLPAGSTAQFGTYGKGPGGVGVKVSTHQPQEERKESSADSPVYPRLHKGRQPSLSSDRSECTAGRNRGIAPRVRQAV